MTKPILPKTSKALATPVRAALRPDSSLQPNVKDGLGALRKTHHVCIDATVRSSFADSVDIDAAMLEGNEQENRWDYLLGYAPSKKIVGVEPHSAENGEIKTVIKKLVAARQQLRDHLLQGKSVSLWIWVASGKVQLQPLEKMSILLSQNGIKFVGRTIMKKHLQ